MRWVTLQESWRAGLTSVLVGAICAVYLGPLVSPLLDPVIGKLSPEGDAQGFAAFVVGLAGISLSGMLIDIIRARRSALQKVAEDEPEPRPHPHDAPPRSLGDPEA